jgi:hypothetical protein
LGDGTFVLSADDGFDAFLSKAAGLGKVNGYVLKYSNNILYN